MKQLRKAIMKTSQKVIRRHYGNSDDPIIISSNRAIIRVISDEENKTYCVTPILMNRKEKREIIYTPKDRF